MQVSKAYYEITMDIEEPFWSYSPEYSSKSTSTNYEADLVQSNDRSVSMSPDNSMASTAEERKTGELSPSLTKLRGTDHRSSCKKNSLKFCRRISKSLIDMTSSNSTNDLSNTVQKLVVFIQAIVEKQIDLLGGSIRDSKGLERLHLDFVRKVWEKNREILSEKKNNKLSLVNFEEWNKLFSFKGFCDRLEGTSNSFSQLFKLIEMPSEILSKAFIGFYSKILYTLNVLMLNIVIFLKMFIDKDITKIIPDLDSFVLMTIEPWIYKHYNHTKAKFALECCSACKICRSSLLPKNFMEKLSNVRVRYQAVKKIFEKYLLELSMDQTASLDASIIPFLTYEIWN